MAKYLVLALTILQGCSTKVEKKYVANPRLCSKDKQCIVLFSGKCKLPHPVNIKAQDYYQKKLERMYRQVSCEEEPQAHQWSSACIENYCTLIKGPLLNPKS